MYDDSDLIQYDVRHLSNRMHRRTVQEMCKFSIEGDGAMVTNVGPI